jgi:peptide/nickel transport system substrate-binding protein
MTSWVSADILNPVMAGFANAGCDKAMFGWPCDEQTEKLRDQFARETADAKKKALAEAIQTRAFEIGTHAPLGEYVNPLAARKSVTGFVTGPGNLYWNIKKN